MSHSSPLFRSPIFKGNTRLAAVSVNNPVMKFGEKGGAVSLVQFALLSLGYQMPVSTQKLGRADGIYGCETRDVIKAFQRKHRLKDDGIIGRNTLERLDALTASPNIWVNRPDFSGGF